MKNLVIATTLVLGVSLSSLALADNCQQQYQGFSFNTVTINAAAGGEVICTYKPSVFYTDKYNSKPTSGPWKSIGVGLVACSSGNASSCSFS